MKYIITTLLIVTLIINTEAASVDTINIYSKAMQKEIKCVVIKPTVVQDETVQLPVVYLLHGHGGWYSNWIIRVPALKDYADQYKIMIVCPDGANSWYFDSPIDSSLRYETYVSKEVPEYIESHYPAIKNRNGRAITGLSMGGHGGLFLGFRHADFYGACGSMSGGVDIRPFKKNWELSQKLGDTLNHWDNWNKYSVINVIEAPLKQKPVVIIDCGTEDFFYTVNRNLHNKMLDLKIPHDYIERPGAHNWEYWKNSIQYQLMFFSNYFKSMKN
ncbi:MAG: esterase family protein [Chitinophagaceae bacterium]|nr:esterase family protein [Chitinophagaceae bacterium]MBP6417547.1 esterase family protein [Chitinophagaceae bacterium]MBP7316274.1 esterase family protein [Chitinophagaceae bacterium]MBP9098694.1 esterase family protein [Ferruginibacter sp.]